MADYIGTTGADFRAGTADVDRYNGAEEADTLEGAQSGDQIMGGNGGDLIRGGDDADVLDGDGYYPTINGKHGFYSGNDQVYGDAGNDLVFGGAGADLLDGGADSDELWGDASGLLELSFLSHGLPMASTPEDASGVTTDSNGNALMHNDTMIGGAGNDTLHSWAGVDDIRGGGGVDLVDLDRSYSSSAFIVDMGLTTQTLADGTFLANVERLNFLGGSQGDMITGGAGADTLVGGGGIDSLSGGGGSDSLTSEQAGESMDGRAGIDTLVLNRAGTSLGMHVDVAELTDGAKLADFTLVSGVEVLNFIGGSGDDEVFGGVYNDTLDGNGGANTLSGGRGDDLYTIHSDADRAFDSKGHDTVRAFVSANLSGPNFAGIEDLIGVGSASVAFTGNAADNHIEANADTASATLRFDTLSGGAGNDTLEAGSAAATLNGGSGDDQLVGTGSLYAVASYVGATAGVDISIGIAGAQATGGAGSDTLVDIVGLIGSKHGDSLGGGDGADVLEGGLGDDSLSGAGGADTLEGGRGDDTLDGGADDDWVIYSDSSRGIEVDLRITGAQDTHDGLDVLTAIEAVVGSYGNDRMIGGAVDETLYGGEGVDILVGNSGADYLSGDDGDDRLFDGFGADTLSGGNGLDRFVFERVETGDLVTDLSDTDDTIDLSFMDANSLVEGNQAFVLVDSFTNTAGEATLVLGDDGNTDLLLDVNGDGVADGSVSLDGDHTGFTNFVL